MSYPSSSVPVAGLLASADPQPTLLLDARGRLCDWNPAMHALLAAGHPPDCLLPYNHGQLVLSVLSQQRAIEEVPVEIPGARHLVWTFIPLAADRVLARARDATEALQNQQQALVARRLYRLIIENTTDLISRHTPEGNFLDASPAAKTLLGYWPEQLRGMPIDELFHPQEREQVIERFRSALDQDGYLTITHRIRHSDGHYRWFETASRAIRETYTGSVVESVSVSRDITERIRSEEKSRRLQDELAHATRLATLGELTSGIAHEINQPLAAIVNYASASQRYLAAMPEGGEAGVRLAQGLERIAGHAQHAAEVIKRMRAFLRKGPRRNQRIDPAGLAQDAVRLCQWEAEQQQVEIVQQGDTPLPDVHGDPVLLQQVLLNLLRNAIEANRETHPDGPSRIILQLDASEQRVNLRVIDQGPGASEEQLERMFTPFFTSKPGGLGLGLSMSQNIIDSFGGGLNAYPADAGGLCLHCWLPALPDNTDNNKGKYA
ncbi:sensor histidine kinase [Pseudomonas sp. MYb185]|uniref:sensor histidine kinase n=1 Tax=Pseudomonas sp. MYb185 TaxID=1848729 RepID=UPI0021151B76|nr:PAS domain-containing sensor histidine kinase [Pseudomonas sp. MYb185]